jgi:hypothetical protein
MCARGAPDASYVFGSAAPSGPGRNSAANPSFLMKEFACARSFGCRIRPTEGALEPGRGSSAGARGGIHLEYLPVGGTAGMRLCHF